jgi:hypothetical protein
MVVLTIVPRLHLHTLLRYQAPCQAPCPVYRLNPCREAHRGAQSGVLIWILCLHLRSIGQHVPRSFESHFTLDHRLQLSAHVRRVCAQEQRCCDNKRNLNQLSQNAQNQRKQCLQGAVCTAGQFAPSTASQTMIKTHCFFEARASWLVSTSCLFPLLSATATSQTKVSPTRHGRQLPK